MSVPGTVQSELDGEQVAAQVPLGGEDALFVTPTRTLVYRADGLLSDESVETYPHDAERIEISEGRRKSAVELDYGIEGEAKFKVPSGRLYEALHPVLAGVLNAADVTGPDETVTQTYQFSELTLVITSERVVKHVGAAVWDEDHEQYHFEDVTRLDVEEGSVSSQIIVETDGRPQRIKTPSDQTREVRERIERALLDYHGAPSYEAFASESAQASEDPEPESDDDAGADQSSADPLAGGVDPIDANPPELDDEGAIVEDDASVTTGEQAGADPQARDGANAGESSAGASEDDEADSASAGGESASAEAESGERAPDEDAGRAAPADGATDADAATEPEQARSPGETTTVDAGDDRESVRTGDVGDDRTTASAEATDADASDSGFADSGFEPASSEIESDDTEAQLEALTEAVERQNELLAEQQRTLETLIDELRRGR